MRIRFKVPRNARRGETIEIKTLVSHPMETGFRRDRVGNAIPRNILTDFVCLYDGVEVFRAQFFPAVAANPYVSFHVVAIESGPIELKWTDQEGKTVSQVATITVT